MNSNNIYLRRKGDEYMGRAKEQLIEKEGHERECPECGDMVWVEWEEKPNLKCSGCEYEDDVKQCENCTNVFSKYSSDIICSLCEDRILEG